MMPPKNKTVDTLLLSGFCPGSAGYASKRRRPAYDNEQCGRGGRQPSYNLPADWLMAPTSAGHLSSTPGSMEHPQDAAMQALPGPGAQPPADLPALHSWFDWLAQISP